MPEAAAWQRSMSASARWTSHRPDGFAIETRGVLLKRQAVLVVMEAVLVVTEVAAVNIC